MAWQASTGLSYPGQPGAQFLGNQGTPIPRVQATHFLGKLEMDFRCLFRRRFVVVKCKRKLLARRILYAAGQQNGVY